MSAPTWSDLMPSDATLAALSAEDLGRISRLADSEATTIKFGISAIGQLMAITAGSGQLNQETATAIGWLLESLGTLSERLAEAERGAEYELVRRAGPAARLAAV